MKKSNAVKKKSKPFKGLCPRCGDVLSRFTVFEMDRLYSLDQRLMNGALFYVFGQIRKRLRSDVPTFMFVDEFRAALSHPLRGLRCSAISQRANPMDRRSSVSSTS